VAITIWSTIADAVKNANRTAVAPLTWNPVDHLLSRFAFGPTPADRQSLTASGPDAWYQAQVSAATQYPGYSGNPDVAAQGPLLTQSPTAVRQWLKSQGNEFGWTAMDQLTQVTLGLQAWSKAQLFETLVDFFSNHLNVANHAPEMWNTRHVYDRDVIRQYAMGSFTDMLLASAKSVAMLGYLNLGQSTKTAVNENYARELLELHTVGLNYTETDVQNAARALTGRTYDANQQYFFNSSVHWVGAVKVLGWSSSNLTGAGGEKVGDDLLRYLAGHSFTAQNLARKLCIRFVSDNPSTDLVNAVAQAYLKNKTQILPMVSTILRSTEFWESRGRKLRRPAENLVATVRVANLAVTDWAKATDTLRWLSYYLGHPPLDWSAPNGYPDVASAWRSCGTLVDTWQMHLALVCGSYGGLAAADISALYGGTPANSGDAIARLSQSLTGSTWTTADLGVLQTFVGESATTSMDTSLLKWWALPLAAVVLDAPHHALR
jgi:uncharacterized protein (DUF1800 family)